MKSEKSILVFTMILNFIVALVKLVFGILFQFSSLVADSFHSLSDFITDIISSIASKVGKKRANKRYPFGYGMIENVSNLVIGFVLFLLAIFIFVRGFQTKDVVLKPIIFVILMVTILLKLVVILLLYFGGKKLGSNVLLSSVRESFTDLFSSVIVLIVSIMLLFCDKYPILKYADLLGSILISVIVFVIAFRIIKENIQYLLGINEDNAEVLAMVRDIINKYKDIKDSSCKLMKVGSYYNLYLVIELDDNISLKRVFRIENKLKKEIKEKKMNIRFIEIELKKYDYGG